MADEGKLREQASRGEALDRASKLFNEHVFDELKQRCINTFEASDLHDEAGHKACRFYLQVLKDIRDRVDALVRTGEAARRELVSPKQPSTMKRIINAARS